MRVSTLIVFLFFGYGFQAYAATPKAPTNLRSCDKIKPAGTDDTPYFGWYINDPDDNEIQTAYQILVASSQQLLDAGKADVWDSKKTTSRLQNCIYFGGKKLLPASRYYWKVRTWDKNENISPYSASSFFETGLFVAKDWTGATWIRRDTKDANDYTYFRKKIQLGAKQIKRATVYLTAFHNYAFYINGKLIGKGLGHHYPQFAYYNAYDVTNNLSNENTLAAMTHWYGGGQGRAKGDRGFLLKLVVEFKDGTTHVSGTDKSWKQMAVEAFNPITKSRNGEGVGYIDVIDSRKAIDNWNAPSFDDAAWQAASEIGTHPSPPFTGELQPDLTRLKEIKIKPVSVKRLGKDTYLIDLGKIYAGMPEIRFEGGKAGDTVNILGGFVLKDDGSVSEKMNQQTDLSYRFVLNGGTAVFKPIVYLGYRYLQINNCPNLLTEANVAFTTRYYELEPGRSDFTSSNDMLSRVWAMMIHSLTLGAQEGFVDTPTREKGEFLGDAWSQAMACISTMSERALSLRVLLEFLDSQDQYWPDGRLNAVYPNADGKRDIPDYTQQYLLWVWGYYMQTGNKVFLKTNYLKLKKIATYVAAYTNPTTNLIDKLAGGSGGYKFGIIDWPATMRYGYDMTTDVRTVINAYAYADFDIISRIAMITGNLADASMFRQKADSLKFYMNKQLINGDGVYTDGLLPDGTQSQHISQHANMFPLALGIVPYSNRTAVTAAVKQKKLSAGMVTIAFLLEALGETGSASNLLNLYTNPEWGGWANIIAKGGTATWESWDAPEYNHSMSHPWGAAGLPGIQKYILGVEPLRPQHELIQVKPLDFGDELKNAAGTFPTDKGDIRVKWVKGSGNYQLTLVTPGNVTANVYIPKGPAVNNLVKVNGKTISAVNLGDYLLIEGIGSGTNVFERISGTPK